MNNDVEVLISTMNLTDNLKLIQKMNITGKSVTINQITDNKIYKLEENGNKNRLYSYTEKGLSKSRNRAIKNCNSDLCVIADDDIVYVDNYEDVIKNAYKKYSEADIIIFYVTSDNINNKKKIIKEGNIGYIKSLKCQSVQMSFKRKSILKSNIRFDEKYGAGTSNYMGEENIFLYDALKKGLKIISVPITIAHIQDGESCWFNGYTEEYFKIKANVYKRMTKTFWSILAIQFAIRKYKYYKNDISINKVIKCMINSKK